MDSTAGVVLTGGGSSRRGREEALLSRVGTVAGTVLGTRTAERFRPAAGSETLTGAPERHAHLNLPAGAGLAPATAKLVPATAKVVPATAKLLPANRGEACGPIGGLYTAPAQTSAGWNYHKRFKIHSLLRLIQAVSRPLAGLAILENVNTRLQWEAW